MIIKIEIMYIYVKKTMVVHLPSILKKIIDLKH